MAYDPSLLLDSKRANKEYGIGDDAPLRLRHVASIDSKWFKFEALVRQDRCVVIHLKDLHHNFRNKSVMDRLTKYISDRVGQHSSVFADFIGEIDTGNGKKMVINSLDIFIYEYLPAKMHDEKFVGDHLSKIGSQLIEQLNISL